MLSVVVLTTFTLSCTTWKKQELAPQQVIAEKHPNHIRVFAVGGTTFELWSPRISGDSLVGSLVPVSYSDVPVLTPGAPEMTPAARPGGVLLSDVQRLEIRGTSAGRTVALVGGVTVMLYAALGIMVAQSMSDYGPSSCPLVYSWDGRSWRLDSGTFGGAIMPALARTDVDNLLYAVPVNDSLQLSVANELNETDYLDRVAVLAVDHRVGLSVSQDDNGRLHTIGALTPPTVARDFRGGDALARVRTPDGWGWESNPGGRDSSRAADVRDGLELEFDRPPGAMHARLVVDASNTPWAEVMMGRFVSLHGTATQAWYDSVSADPRLAGRLGAMMAREVYLGVRVDVNGRWERRGMVREAGPEVVKRQVVPLDLSGTTDDMVRVRLESAPSLWLIDHVGIDYSPPEPLSTRELALASARTSGGTDVRSLLSEADGRELVMERGDRAELMFAVPPAPSGMVRSFLLVTRGWYRLHVAAAGTPQTTLLERLMAEPLAASRLVTGDLAAAVAALDGERP
jgi:hypothetical protein